jgi:PKD repeat protein
MVQNPLVEETITFNASSSYDPDGTITKYEWNFGDGNITNTTDPLITHTYVSAGDYTVNLTVTDDEGEYSYTESSTTIKEPIKEPAFYVPDDYSTIQAAVDAASAGDTIIVREGTYYEKVVVDKSLTIKSSSGSPEYTIVDAVDPYADVFSVTADHVNISGFTVTGAPDFYGIYLYNADYCDKQTTPVLTMDLRA